MTQNQNQDELFNLLQDQQKQAQVLKQVEALERTIKQYLSKEAITRYGTLKTAHPDKAMQVLLVLAELIQNKQITHPLSDAEFKSILLQIQKPRKEFKVNLK